MHAAVFRFPHGEVQWNAHLAVLRRDNNLRLASTRWHKPDYVFDRCAVHVVAAVFWIPIVPPCWRESGQADEDRQGNESGADGLDAIATSFFGHETLRQKRMHPRGADGVRALMV